MIRDAGFANTRVEPILGGRWQFIRVEAVTA